MARPRPRDRRWRVIALAYGTVLLLALLGIGIIGQIGFGPLAGAMHIDVALP